MHYMKQWNLLNLMNVWDNFDKIRVFGNQIKSSWDINNQCRQPVQLRSLSEIGQLEGLKCYVSMI